MYWPKWKLVAGWIMVRMQRKQNLKRGSRIKTNYLFFPSFSSAKFWASWWSNGPFVSFPLRSHNTFTVIILAILLLTVNSMLKISFICWSKLKNNFFVLNHIYYWTISNTSLGIKRTAKGMKCSPHSWALSILHVTQKRLLKTFGGQILWKKNGFAHSPPETLIFSFVKD